MFFFSGQKYILNKEKKKKKWSEKTKKIEVIFKRISNHEHNV